MAGKAEKKSNTRSRIISYVMNNENTSKVEISKNLNISMPTVLSNVNERANPPAMLGRIV